jgi:hypothetical protein
MQVQVDELGHRELSIADRRMPIEIWAAGERASSF